MSWGPLVVNLAVTAGTVAVLMLATFGYAIRTGVHTIMDTVWPPGFVIIALVSFGLSAGDGDTGRRFRADPANAGRLLDRGLWRYIRHPNYFGDAVVWFGLWLLACWHWLVLATDDLAGAVAAHRRQPGYRGAAIRTHLYYRRGRLGSRRLTNRSDALLGRGVGYAAEILVEDLAEDRLAGGGVHEQGH